MIAINANGKTNAYEVIMDHGFIDVLPDVDFYDYEKFYRKDGKDYKFDGWNIKKVNGENTFPSLNLREID